MIQENLEVEELNPPLKSMSEHKYETNMCFWCMEDARFLQRRFEEVLREKILKMADCKT